MRKASDRNMTFASLRCALLFAVAGVVASTAGRSLRQSVEIDGSSVIDQDTFPFLQAPLNYSFDALEPSIDAPTMFIHFTRHHRGQVNGLNSALERYPDLDGMILDDLMALVGTSRMPADIASAMRNSGGGHWNHRFFWQVMGAGIDPEVGPDAPQLREGPLYDAIIASFGSVDELRTQFTDTAASQFGSGWGWLCLKKESSGGEVQAKLITTSTPNQDNPLMALSDEPCTPLLGVDVWEHAYYLEYQNRRRTYLEAFWDVVNWAFVEKVYIAAMG